MGSPRSAPRISCSLVLPRTAADVIDDLNLVMTWASYPGRSTAAVTTADWDPEC